jgi:hypothetical protein
MTKKERDLLDDMFLQPWFLPKDTAFQIRAISTSHEVLAVKRRWTAAGATNVPRMFSSVLDAQRLLKDLITPSGRVRRTRCEG